MVNFNQNANGKLFFVVDSLETEKEIFETYGEAIDYFNEFPHDEKPRISIELVNNTYFDEGKLMYDDRSNTFNFIMNI